MSMVIHYKWAIFNSYVWHNQRVTVDKSSTHQGFWTSACIFAIEVVQLLVVQPPRCLHSLSQFLLADVLGLLANSLSQPNPVWSLRVSFRFRRCFLLLCNVASFSCLQLLRLLSLVLNFLCLLYGLRQPVFIVSDHVKLSRCCWLYFSQTTRHLSARPNCLLCPGALDPRNASTGLKPYFPDEQSATTMSCAIIILGINSPYSKNYISPMVVFGDPGGPPYRKHPMTNHYSSLWPSVKLT